MALNYLLSPEFQIVNSAGRPASGGFLEVYVHGTRDKYFCASDFDGTLHPFRVPLDSLGSNVVLADDSHAYDVYIYNRYGTLLMSRYNVNPSSGGSMGGVITSSDGSITVTPTVDGYDLSTRDNKASTLRAAAEPLYADGFYSFSKLEGEGECIYIDNGNIKLEDGWYHFSATVKLNWNGNITPHTGTIRLYSGLTYDIVDFDYSYNHSDSILLDGDIFIGAHSSHYISFGRNFTLGITGMPTGMTAELVDCDIHSIIGQGVGGGEKNIHRLLRYFTNANEADAQHPVGDWLHDLDAEDPEDPSGHPMVTADQLFDWYDEGQIFELYEVDGSNGQLGWSAVYRMVTWQDQSDWWSQYAPVPGKACRLEFYRMGGYSSVNRGMMIAYIRYKEEDYMRLYQIMPGQDVWTMDFQQELTAGSNISISGSTISATDTTYTAGTGLSLTGTEFSADTSVLATQSDLAGKQDTLTAGSNITINNNVISATDTTYTAGTGIDITGDVISADTSVVATQSDLAGKQDTLTAGTGITIQNNVISATAAQQVQSNWNETDTADPSYIQNKPDLSIYATDSELSDGLAAKQDTISDLSDIRSGAALGATSVQDVTVDGVSVVSDGVAAITTPSFTQQQANWAESDPTAVSYIQNKPSNLVQDASYVHTDENFTSAEKTKLAGIESGAEVNVQSDWTESDSSSDAYIQNKPQNLVQDASYVHTDENFTSAEKTKLAGIEANAEVNVQSDWNESDSSSDAYIQNKPDLSVYATQNDLAGKQDTLTAGSNISISNNVISATDTTYSAGTGIDITGTTISADTSVLATQSDLSGKQDTLTAGTNIQINGTTISATDTTYSAGTGIDITGTTISADTTVLATQNDLSSKQDTLTAGSNITISNNTISATDTTYSAGTGLSLTGTTFSNADPLPAHTSSESGKILKVDSNGDLEWGSESGGTVTDVQVNGTSVVSGGVADITVPAAQVNSDWTATSGVAEILHKPTEKTLAAGSNITITELNDTVTISSTGTTYTAGTGIDISNNEISVETPVDIVAGPGIVIDNPDGNTLRVSQDSNYEVELYYSPTNHNVATNAEFEMSESIWNFSKVLITFDNMEFENRTCTMLIDLAVSNTGTFFCTPYCNGDTPGTLNICWAAFNINAAGNIKYLNRGLIYGTWTAPAFTTGTSRGYRVKRVVGINRINGGN